MVYRILAIPFEGPTNARIPEPRGRPLDVGTGGTCHHPAPAVVRRFGATGRDSVSDSATGGGGPGRGATVAAVPQARSVAGHVGRIGATPGPRITPRKIVGA